MSERDVEVTAGDEPTEHAPHGHSRHDHEDDHDHGRGQGHAHAQEGAHRHEHAPGEHGHSHGLLDRSITRSRAGINAVSLSLAVLLATAIAQAAIFVLSDSVALLAA